MKKRTNLFAMLLAMLLAVALALPAFAASGTYTITINNSTQGHTYEAYQVFAGDLSEGVLSNITWGDGVNGDALLTALQGDETIGSTFTGCENGADVAAKLTSDNYFTTDSDNMKAFADIVGQHLSTTTSGTCNEGTVSGDSYTYQISGVAAGYYLIQDKAPAEGSSIDAYTRYILQVVKDTAVSPKSDVPSVEKKVQEKNDSTSTDPCWQDGADYDIGDSVPFKLTGTLPSTLADYDSYKYVFHDTLSNGLELDEDSVKVYVASTKDADLSELTPLTSGKDYTLTPSPDEGHCSFEVSFNNVKGVKDVTPNSYIIVTYTAELTSDAFIGNPGNPNRVYLEFSNNPYAEGTGKTPEDKVTVFTFKLDVDKVDKDQHPLEGAGFTLYKYNAATRNYVVVGSEVTGDQKTNFVWSGLDSGKYKLVESTVPAGYNKADDIEFTIEAEYTTDGADQTLKGLVVKNADGSEIISGNDEGSTFTATVETGIVATDVVNTSGLELPETGGMGTTLFYVLGGILVVGAGVLLVAKKRMGDHSEQ